MNLKVFLLHIQDEIQIIQRTKGRRYNNVLNLDVELEVESQSESENEEEETEEKDGVNIEISSEDEVNLSLNICSNFKANKLNLI